MPLTEICRVRLGTSNGWLIPAREGCVLMDAGHRDREGQLFRALEHAGFRPQDIRLIVVTHVHFDHVGGLRAIRQASGAPVLVHRAEADLLAQGRVVIPPGVYPYTRVVSAIGQCVGPALFGFAPDPADVVVDNGYSLRDFGLDGAILHTPGHTDGSITLLLDGGRAFVGDLSINTFMNRRSAVPVFADSLPTIYASWRTLLDAGVRTIYPGHGAPFDAARLRAELAAHECA